MRDTMNSTFSINYQKWVNPINPPEFIMVMSNTSEYCAKLFNHCLTFFLLFRQTVLGIKRKATSELQERIFLQY